MSIFSRFLPHKKEREALAKLSADVDDTLSDLDETVMKFKDKVECEKISRRTGRFMTTVEGEKA